MPDVRIVDLEIIKRFSLAVRQEYADAEEVLEALESSLDQVHTAADGGRRNQRAARARKPASRSKKSASKKKSTKKTAKKSTKKKPAKKKTSRSGSKQ